MEVRFFGGYHRKALVERHHIKPISTNVHSLQIKRTSEWNKASEELKRYQELHDKYKDKPEFLTDQYGDPFDGEKVSGDIQISHFVSIITIKTKYKYQCGYTFR